MHVKTLSTFIKLKLSLFALPWTIAAALFAVNYEPEKSLERWDIWVWIVVAFFAARTAGMSLNRLIDRDIDAANSRTKRRLLPSGQVKVTEAITISVIALFAFIFACFMINTVCFLLSPLVVFLLMGYSYTKRWTAGCHFVLGSIYLLAPVMAWAAIQGNLAWPPFLLGVASMLSIAAVDMIYALADHSFDRLNGLRSFPVYFGEKNTVYIAVLLHCLTLLLLYAFGVLLELSWIWSGGLLLIALRYIQFYVQLFQNLNVENLCFSCNTSISMLLLITTLGECLWRITS